MLLMPPSLSVWLPECGRSSARSIRWTWGGSRRRIGLAGGALYDPRMMVGLLLHSYARGVPSSRGIARAGQGDVAFKVITRMRVPDHSTIAEFRRRQEVQIAGLFDDLLALCAEAGLVSVGAITIGGTKIEADGRPDAGGIRVVTCLW